MTNIVYGKNDKIDLPSKHPASIATYTVYLNGTDGTNTAGGLGWLQGRTVSSISVTTPNGITLAFSTYDDTSFTIVVSGGTANTDYEFDVLVTPSDTYPVNFTVIVPVRNPGS